jgi:hypothetical protein
MEVGNNIEVLDKTMEVYRDQTLKNQPIILIQKLVKGFKMELMYALPRMMNFQSNDYER